MSNNIQRLKVTVKNVRYLSNFSLLKIGIPTSRAATLVVSDDPVVRDQFYDGRPQSERAAIVLRLAPSWFRIGSLEILAKNNEVELLKELLDFVIKNHFPGIDVTDENRYLALYSAIVSETAQLVASWQSVGFTHGVCNTDNFSLLSITIDYGPFGFMEEYNPKFVPNTSDDEGRYSFENQPDVGAFNLNKLGEALRRNGTPPLFDVLPFEINNENYFLLIGIVCTIFDNFPRSSVG